VRGLEAKRVLITGGGSGIGAATASRFLDEGSVVCVLDRDAEARANLLRELPDLVTNLDMDAPGYRRGPKARGSRRPSPRLHQRSPVGV
jgi:NAD(P)-dependent dehydrogenase (short-subunit alcohol dehydrogenase family)